MDIFKVFSNDQLLDRAWRVAAQGYRHRDYKHTMNVAKWCYQMNTGDDQKEILINFRAKESAKQKKQRVTVTNSRTPQVANKVKSLYNEVHRTDDVIDNIHYGNDGAEFKQRIQDLSEEITSYHGKDSVRDFLTKKNSYYTFFDPNAWHIVEYERHDSETEIYPFEITSAQAVDYNETRGILQYVVSCIIRKFKQKDSSGYVENRKYTLYAAGANIDIIEVPEKRTELEGWKDPAGYTLAEKDTNEKKKKQFFYKVFETPNKHCPAKRFGFIPDPKTKGRTCLSPLHYSKKVFTRLIWRTSTLDISHALHGFYQKFMYAERCNHRTVIENRSYECDGGYIGSSKCEKCKGTGKRIHLSDQDVVMFLLDGNRDKVDPLSNFVHYETIPTELIKEQREEVHEAISDALSTIFNENIFDKSILANTATGIHYNWRAVNNRLMDYGDFDSAMYKFTILTVATIRGLDEGLQIDHGYPSDFKLESIQELLADRQTAVGAQSPAEVIFNLDVKVLSKQHRDNPEFIARFKAKEMFRPLRTKSLQERIVILEPLPEYHPMKILNQYFDEIFDMVFAIMPNFPEANYIKQKQFLDKQVSEWIEREKELRQELTPSFVDSTPNGQATTQQGQGESDIEGEQNPDQGSEEDPEATGQ